MGEINTERLTQDVKEAARLRGISEDKVIVEIVAMYAPVYIKSIEKVK